MRRLLLACLLVLTGTWGFAQVPQGFYVERTKVNGKDVDAVFIPGKPPPNVKPASVNFGKRRGDGDVLLSNMPTFEWNYGCAATSAGMMIGYYDRTGYSNMYTGSVNNGVCPMTNDKDQWGAPITYTNGSREGTTCYQCSFVASRQGLAGRENKGHVDDYWVNYGSADDPYYGNWTEHSPPDCLGDFMGTNQYQNFKSTDGGTWWFPGPNGTVYTPSGSETNGDGSPSRDGTWGMKLYAEDAGYTAETYYNQYIKGYNNYTEGFTFANYQAEIDAGRPVMVVVEGHAMVGVGYNATGEVVYLKDTWHHGEGETQQMTWGGSYSGMAHMGVSVFQLKGSGEDEKPTISHDVSGDAIEVTCVAGTDAESQTFNVWNGGKDTLEFTVSDDKTWLSCSPGSGSSTGSDDQVAITVSFSTSDMEEGSSDTATITITDSNATNSPVTISVSVSVGAADKPTVGTDVKDDVLYVTCTTGTNAQSETINVWNSGADTLSFTVSDDKEWLSCSPESGESTGITDKQALELTFSTSSLSAGGETAIISLTDADASNSPKKIYVVLTVTNEGEVPEISLDESAFSVTCDVGSSPLPETFDVWNSGTGTLFFTVGSDKEWLVCSPTSGTSTDSGVKETITMTFDTASLPVGTKDTGTVTITGPSASNSPQTVTVNLEVLSRPKISLDSDSENWSYDEATGTYLLTLSTSFSKNPSMETFSVANGTDGTLLRYFISKNRDWISVSPTEGDSTDSDDSDMVAVTFNTTLLAVGEYEGTVTVADANASNNPQTINVDLTIGAAEVPNDDLRVGLTGSGLQGITHSSNNHISFWADASGQGNNAYQRNGSKQPSLKTPIQGSAVARFDGKDLLLVDNGPAISSDGPYTAKTIAVAFQTGFNITSRQVIFEQGDAHRGINAYIDDSRLHVNAWNLKEDGTGAPWGPVTLSANVTQEKYHVLVVMFDQPNGTLTANLNAVKIGEATGVGPLYSSSQGLALGGVQGGTYFEGKAGGGAGFKGYLCEFYYYNELLTTAEVNAIQTNLASKFNDTFMPLNDFDTWLSAGKGTDVEPDHNRVVSWLDGSINEVSFRQGAKAKRPIWYEDLLGENLPGITFGGEDFLSAGNSDAINSNRDGYREKSLFMVFRTGSDVTSPQCVWSQGDKKTGLNVCVGNGLLNMSVWNLRKGKGHSSWATTISGAVAANTLYLAQFVYDEPGNQVAGYLRVLKSTESKYTLGTASAIGVLQRHRPATIGAVKGTTYACGDGKSGSYFRGDVFEIIMYNSVLSSDQTIEVDDYLSKKYISN